MTAKLVEQGSMPHSCLRDRFAGSRADFVDCLGRCDPLGLLYPNGGTDRLQTRKRPKTAEAVGRDRARLRRQIQRVNCGLFILHIGE
jgi:hypothetical protein